MANHIMQQPFKKERFLGERATFMSSDEKVLMKQIEATHAPDGRDINAKPILAIVQDIFYCSNQDVMVKEVLEEGIIADVTATVEALSYMINRISSEISYKCITGVDAHSMTMSIFNMLSSYSWDAKLMITLAAFALNYGEFWLLMQIYSTNRLANKMAILKQLTYVMEDSSQLKPRFDALRQLLICILDLAKCVVEFKELPPMYISPEKPALSTAIAYLPTAIYWGTRSVIACANNITYLSAMGREYITSTAEVWELSSLNHKISTINDHLKKQLTLCLQLIEEVRQREAYDALLHTFDAIHLDNMKVVKEFIYPKDDILPLLDGSSKKRVNVEVLRRKTTLLLISGLDISTEELAILEQIYSESRHYKRPENAYELVWIPVVDMNGGKWKEGGENLFETLQHNMPWYSVNHPSLINQSVIKFIKEKLHFNEKAILVVLDPQGKIVSPNALPMMWIWGSIAFPFTSAREQALWKEEAWRLELIVDGIDPYVLNWIKDDRYIILYGSDDIEWIRKFIMEARNVIKAGLNLEMIYVGKSSKREQIRKVTDTIYTEKLSHKWEDVLVWFFWTRLECMLFSKMELGGGSTDEEDAVLHEIKKLMSYDKSGSWALFSNGSKVTLTGYGPTALAVLQQYDTWKVCAEEKGFDAALVEYYGKLPGHPCSRFEFEATLGRTPESMKCPECTRFMEKYVTFSCCHD